MLILSVRPVKASHAWEKCWSSICMCGESRDARTMGWDEEKTSVAASILVIYSLNVLALFAWIHCLPLSVSSLLSPSSLSPSFSLCLSPLVLLPRSFSPLPPLSSSLASRLDFTSALLSIPHSTLPLRFVSLSLDIGSAPLLFNPPAPTDAAHWCGVSLVMLRNSHHRQTMGHGREGGREGGRQGEEVGRESWTVRKGWKIWRRRGRERERACYSLLVDQFFSSWSTQSHLDRVLCV